MTINPPLRLLAAYQQHINRLPSLVVPVPGRDMWAAADLGEDYSYTVIAPDLQARVTFDRRSARQNQTIRHRPLPRWVRYAAGVIVVMSQDKLDLPGGTIVIVGDEPSGPRYEHAIGLAFAALGCEYHHLPYDLDALLDIVDRANIVLT